ncbi:hypothetical protein [Crassaminicella indica]|uniref:Uncharacterized protein n=1 Tax=Crassaminicella indica TaxID=2855394 RepID=A0ABX8RH63_9CLOT|nr:hypothetical protein [Crassaminicella indica]QXM06291.1 hypothetical protein KVH43_00155 [Crassaminicella indica]
MKKNICIIIILLLMGVIIYCLIGTKVFNGNSNQIVTKDEISTNFVKKASLFKNNFNVNQDRQLQSFYSLEYTKEYEDLAKKNYQKAICVKDKYPEIKYVFDLIEDKLERADLEFKKGNNYLVISNYDAINELSNYALNYDKLKKGVVTPDVLYTIAKKNYDVLRSKLYNVKKEIINIELNNLTKNNFFDIFALEYTISNSIDSLPEYNFMEKHSRECNKQSFEDVMVINSRYGSDMLDYKFIKNELSKIILEDKENNRIDIQKIIDYNKKLYTELQKKETQIIKFKIKPEDSLMFNSFKYSMKGSLIKAKKSRNAGFNLLCTYHLLYTSLYYEEIKEILDFDKDYIDSVYLLERLYSEKNKLHSKLLCYNEKHFDCKWINDRFIDACSRTYNLLNEVKINKNDPELATFLRCYLSQNYMFMKVADRLLSYYEIISKE